MTQFISEISSNHNSNLKRSLKLINVSSKIGFDIVKFQLFKIDKLFSKEILFKSKNHRDRKKWELKEKYIPILAKECKKNKIKFCVTPFYLEAVDIIKPYVDFIKIASYEILWEDLLIKCAKTKKPIIISTGMASMSEIEYTYKIAKKYGSKDITLLYCVSNYPSKISDFNLNNIKILKKNGAKKIIILHCVSNYPAKLKSLNLSAISTLRKKTKLDIGWSDHSAKSLVVYKAIQK